MVITASTLLLELLLIILDEFSRSTIILSHKIILWFRKTSTLPETTNLFLRFQDENEGFMNGIQRNYKGKWRELRQDKGKERKYKGSVKEMIRDNSNTGCKGNSKELWRGIKEWSRKL